MEKTVYIKASKWKITKRFLFLWLVASPILIFVFGEDNNPQHRQNTENMKLVFTWIYFLYCGILLGLWFYRIAKADQFSLVKLDEKGITISEKVFFKWADIYDFRTGVKILKYNVLNKNGGNSGRREIEEKKILVINEQEFFINEKYSSFTVGEIAEIIGIYKERMSTSSPKEVPENTQIFSSKTEEQA